jgi:hypothetical protein
MTTYETAPRQFAPSRFPTIYHPITKNRIQYDVFPSRGACLTDAITFVRKTDLMNGRTVLRILAILVAVPLLAGIIGYFALDRAEPEDRTGVEADLLAQRMLDALDVAAWDTTRYLEWTFRGKHSYLWDRERNLVRFRQGGLEVLLDADDITGTAVSDGRRLEGQEADDAIAGAWRNFCNDGFWLYAPFKVLDGGTVRSIVTMEDGSEALKVTYMEGGVTPGDSYLWILGSDGRPIEWRMWVSIIPVGGISFRITGWEQLPTGAWLPVQHKGKLFSLRLTGVRSAQRIAEGDPFAGMD